MKRLKVNIFLCMEVGVVLLAVLAVALTAVGALSAPAAFASSSLFKKGGEPICTVTSTSSSSSSTTCTGTLAGNNKSSNLSASTDVSGFAVFQCQTTGSTPTTGQNTVGVETQSSSTPIPTGQSATFTTNPAVLTAPSTVSAQAAGCPDGSTAVNPTLTTTTIKLIIDNGSIMGPICTASNPNGLSGTVPLSC